MFVRAVRAARVGLTRVSFFVRVVRCVRAWPWLFPRRWPIEQKLIKGRARGAGRGARRRMWSKCVFFLVGVLIKIWFLSCGRISKKNIGF